METIAYHTGALPLPDPDGYWIQPRRCDVPSSLRVAPYMRTGCMRCLIARKRCDLSDPTCVQNTVTNDWRINRSLEQSYGSWRERQGLHVFTLFALSPNSAGFFRSSFWHRTILVACQTFEPLRRLGSAVGSLYEHLLKSATTDAPLDDGNTSFALRQCNVSIELLTEQNDQKYGLEVTLIACLLFIFFESLQGNTEHAVAHCLQSRALMDSLENLSAAGRAGALVSPNEVRSVILGLEIQARCIPGASLDRQPIVESTTSFLPKLSSPISSLDHANNTLHTAHITLLATNDSINTSMPLDRPLERLEAKRSKFLPWFHQWHTAFTDYCTEHQSSFSIYDLQRCNVLKANYHILVILATLDLRKGHADWPPHTAAFRTITDLSATALNLYDDRSQALKSILRFPFFAGGFDVFEPLFLTMARCADPDIRRQAGQLLIAQKDIWRRSRSSRSLSSGEHEANGTESWSLKDWLDFTAQAPPAIGMAVFFGNFQPPGLRPKMEQP